MPPKNHFLMYLPRAGFRYHKRTSVLRRYRNDIKIINTLHAAGFTTRDQVELALVSMFNTATELANEVQFNRGLIPSHEFTVQLHPRVSWAAALTKAQFSELFSELTEARYRWWEKPQFPYRLLDHGVLAHSIDEFDLAAGTSWLPVDMSVFKPPEDSAKGKDSGKGRGDGDDEEKEEEKNEEEDDEEEEVREVREHLADTDLGDEMDWE